MSDVIDFASKSWKSKRLVFVFYSRVTRLFLPLTAPFTLSHLRVHVHAREFFITLPHLFLLESFFISFVQKLRRENEKEEEKKKFLKSATFFFRFRCRDEKQKGIVNKLLATCFTRVFFSLLRSSTVVLKAMLKKFVMIWNWCSISIISVLEDY